VASTSSRSWSRHTTLSACTTALLEYKRALFAHIDCPSVNAISAAHRRAVATPRTDEWPPCRYGPPTHLGALFQPRGAANVHNSPPNDVRSARSASGFFATSWKHASLLCGQHTDSRHTYQATRPPANLINLKTDTNKMGFMLRLCYVSNEVLQRASRRKLLRTITQWSAKPSRWLDSLSVHIIWNFLSRNQTSPTSDS